MKLPLADFKIVEFGNLVAAPYCGMLLADLGAEVVKVEAITGDLARAIGPFYGDESAFFISVNRGKRSLAADAKAESIKPVLRKLCLGADVVLHNLRQGSMERMGLGYEDLRNDGAHLVYAMITAFGGTGPASARPGIDLIFQGESGMMSIAGGADDPPQKTATTIGDFVAGTNAALTITAALAAGGGRRGGRGRLVEVSLRDGLIAVQAGWNALFFAHGVQPPRTGTASPVTAPNQTFHTADGFVNVAVVSDRHFRDLCTAIEMGDVASIPQFGSNALRVANRLALAAILEPAFLGESTGHWIEVLGRAGVPVGRILEFEEVFSDPQAVHNEMVIHVEHPKAGAIRTQGSPLRLDGISARAELPAPFLGQHSRSVLAELGFSGDQIDEFVAAGAVVA